MDPNANLERLRELVERSLDRDSVGLSTRDVFEAFELFTALDEWLSSGGFLPSEWKSTK